jgi:hypothetical protein
MFISFFTIASMCPITSLGINLSASPPNEMPTLAPSAVSPPAAAAQIWNKSFLFMIFPKSARLILPKVSNLESSVGLMQVVGFALS